MRITANFMESMNEPKGYWNASRKKGRGKQLCVGSIQGEPQTKYSISSLQAIKQKNRAIACSVFVVPAGLEPAAHGLENHCSIQLSYGTVSLNCLTIFGDANKQKNLNH